MKKTTKKLLAAATLMALLTFVACSIESGKTVQAQAGAEQLPLFLEVIREFEKDLPNSGTSDYQQFLELRDTETGVHYFLYRESERVFNDGAGIGVSLCPRYNADGTLYIGFAKKQLLRDAAT